MNTVVSVASLASAAALVSPSIAAAAPIDPMLAAIERHRAAALSWMKTLSVEDALERSIPEDRRKSYTTYDRHDPEVGRDDDPRWTEYQAGIAMSDAMEDAAIEFVDLVPTSMAGVIAMLTYIEDFNRGALVVSENNYSSESLFPEDLIDDDIVDRRGKPKKMSFEYFVLRNVRRALQNLSAAQHWDQVAPEVKKSSVEAPPDRLLELVTAYEAGAAKTDDMSTYIGMPEDEWDSVYENNVLPPMRALATEQPPATSAEGAIAAISHVMNDEDFFANRESAMNEMVLWAMLKGARSYIAAAAARGDIDRNVRLLPLLRSVG